MTSGDALENEAGVLLLAADGSIVMSDAAGERWLAQLGMGRSGAAPVLAAVASRAVARVRAPSGISPWTVQDPSRRSGWARAVSSSRALHGVADLLAPPEPTGMVTGAHG